MITAGSATPAWGSQSLTLQRQSIGGHGAGGGAVPPRRSPAPAPRSAPACLAPPLPATAPGAPQSCQPQPSHGPQLPGDPAPSPAIPALAEAEASTGSLPPARSAQSPREGHAATLCALTAPWPVLWSQELVPVHRTQPRDSWTPVPSEQTAASPKQSLPPAPALECTLPGGDAGVMLHKQQEEEDSHWHWPNTRVRPCRLLLG